MSLFVFLNTNKIFYINYEQIYLTHRDKWTQTLPVSATLFPIKWSTTVRALPAKMRAYGKSRDRSLMLKIFFEILEHYSNIFYEHCQWHEYLNCGLPMLCLVSVGLLLKFIYDIAYLYYLTNICSRNVGSGEIPKINHLTWHSFIITTSGL